MRKFVCVVMVLAVVGLCTGCFTMQHTVGQGPQMGTETTHRQWFALWGLVPVNPTDSQEIAGNAGNYRVTTQWAPLDILLNIFTGSVTFYSRTITVEK